MKEGTKEYIKADTKTMFDSLRNVLICAAFYIGAAYIYIDSPQFFGSDVPANYVVILLILFGTGLYVMNIIWLFISLNARLKNRFVHYLGGLSLLFFATIASAFPSLEKLMPFIGNLSVDMFY